MNELLAKRNVFISSHTANVIAPGVKAQAKSLVEVFAVIPSQIPYKSTINFILDNAIRSTASQLGKSVGSVIPGYTEPVPYSGLFSKNTPKPQSQSPSTASGSRGSKGSKGTPAKSPTAPKASAPTSAVGISLSSFLTYEVTGYPVVYEWLPTKGEISRATLDSIEKAVSQALDTVVYFLKGEWNIFPDFSTLEGTISWLFGTGPKPEFNPKDVQAFFDTLISKLEEQVAALIPQLLEYLKAQGIKDIGSLLGGGGGAAAPTANPAVAPALGPLGGLFGGKTSKLGVVVSGLLEAGALAELIDGVQAPENASIAKGISAV
ncbi:hypothetical protein BT63DRAFT_426602 [Microthyrium microscopicum]|uniref:Uncharacterized protein n=1 Tax=Microthyrium microscopicum TaxID=703497 RepID=A0A6A6UA27_9PEZI|nr:hypothetical protein BT63DRAFT_426602 [Microthyrium microscopicum]